jgi:streptogramin lyase
MRNWLRHACIFTEVAAFALLAGCSSDHTGTTAAGSLISLRSNGVVSPSTTGHWKQIKLKGVTTGSGGAAASTDGRSVWFALQKALVRVDVAGHVRVVPVPYGPSALAFGNDGRLYTRVCCTLSGYYAVMAVTTSGDVSLYVPPSKDDINDGMALGSDGNIWISELTHVAKITPTGTFTEYAIPLPPNVDANNEAGIIAGPHATVLFPIVDDTISHPTGYLARIHTANGKIDETSIPCSGGFPLVLGVDKSIYEACPDPYTKNIGILRVPPTRSQRVYQDPYGVFTAGAQSFAVTPDGLVWAITFASNRNPNQLSSLDPRTGRIIEYLTPPALGALSTIVLGPGNHIWALSAEAAEVGIFDP